MLAHIWVLIKQHSTGMKHQRQHLRLQETQGCNCPNYFPYFWRQRIFSLFWILTSTLFATLYCNYLHILRTHTLPIYSRVMISHRWMPKYISHFWWIWWLKTTSRIWVPVIILSWKPLGGWRNGSFMFGTVHKEWWFDWTMWEVCWSVSEYTHVWWFPSIYDQADYQNW